MNINLLKNMSLSWMKPWMVTKVLRCSSWHSTINRSGIIVWTSGMYISYSGKGLYWLITPNYWMQISYLRLVETSRKGTNRILLKHSKPKEISTENSMMICWKCWIMIQSNLKLKSSRIIWEGSRMVSTMTWSIIWTIKLMYYMETKLPD